MTANQSDLHQSMMALADPTRRAIVHRLSEGESRVTEFAQPFAISLNSVSWNASIWCDVGARAESTSCP